MSDTSSFSFRLSESETLKAVEEYVNRSLFKLAVTLTSMDAANTTMRAADDVGHGFEFIAQFAPHPTEPRISSPKKEKKERTAKHGLGKSVLEQQPSTPMAVNGGMGQEA